MFFTLLVPNLLTKSWLLSGVLLQRIYGLIRSSGKVFVLWCSVKILLLQKGIGLQVIFH